ncbi:pantoate--beta-alanine ligase [Corynebacterium renale]|uniref:pantoate--beta-alanine ligase (AMP-forming) n=1 Tax=Corynebacterium renale TaxID=1724 RepID=A0A2A9DNR3_9CORY|nr:pantoate--beta-alanine ligase [Corynebacterium renale]PFG27996.1 pantothenate synthetase [Corynebacterium renale]SQG63281.1 pantoate--beta-alanine ligase [Corynebacterium renale]SQI21446.1 pantoate--beta-alanine ligase [Corynebacterium renale]STC99319.1 pantoate--beta-alanine ligase [Corynebacterium renale]
MALELGTAALISDPQRATMTASALRKTGKPVVAVPVGRVIHGGHQALLRAARRLPGAVVFAVVQNTDDAELLKAEGVDFTVLLPREATDTLVVPADYGLEDPGRLAHDLTYLVRVAGVLRPQAMILGEKDAELLAAFQRAVTDLQLGLKIRSVPTVRMPDGLALSVRNERIAPTVRDKAIAISAALTAGAYAAEYGAAKVIETARDVLAAAGLAPDYLEVRSPDMGPAPAEGDARLLCAVELPAVDGGTVRLLDSVGLPLGIGFKNLDNQG